MVLLFITAIDAALQTLRLLSPRASARAASSAAHAPLSRSSSSAQSKTSSILFYFVLRDLEEEEKLRGDGALVSTSLVLRKMESALLAIFLCYAREK